MEVSGKKIYLIGFMGSGKSTLGKRLASNLGWSFIDLDKKIEQRAGLKVPEIFSTKGEAWFRNAESEALRSLAAEDKVVISTGGGTPCSGDNMAYMNETGLTVYLEMNPIQLHRRLARSAGQRPLLKDIGSNELLDFIGKKLGEREHWYSMAAITIDGESGTVSHLLTQVKDWIQK
jgi:shikimate kinase